MSHETGALSEKREVSCEHAQRGEPHPLGVECDECGVAAYPIKPFTFACPNCNQTMSATNAATPPAAPGIAGRPDEGAPTDELTEVRQAYRRFKLAVLAAMGTTDPWAITVENERRICERINRLFNEAVNPPEVSKLVEFFRSPEGETIGRQGDHDNLSPADTAIREMRRKSAGQRPLVHNHGPEDGPGLACREVRQADGSLLGECMKWDEMRAERLCDLALELATLSTRVWHHKTAPADRDAIAEKAMKVRHELTDGIRALSRRQRPFLWRIQVSAYHERLAEIDSWLFDAMANERVRVTVEGEVGDQFSDQVTASFYEWDGREWRHVDDGLGDTPLDALWELREQVNKRSPLRRRRPSVEGN